MTTQVNQLIADTINLTGAAPPALLDADAPVLAPATTGSLYLIGLVGGKDVGKSSLVNAIAGCSITAPTSYGPGTQVVVAYAHEAAADELRQLLQREVPGQFTLVTHHIGGLERQVLLDLPDIDSQYDQHVQITRRMLRHMLYPVWIQSVEKYADQRPQELLAAVAEGNDPANFIFCLNKADQLLARDGAAAANELREDYSSRIAKLLSLPARPRVFLVSATHADEFDLPALRSLLSRGKSDDLVAESRGLACRRQDRSLLGWFDRQRLDERAKQLARLQRDAEELAASRIALPLLDLAIPALIDDPGQRMSLVAPAIQLRLSRWPIINAIDALLWPVLALVQKNLGAAPSGSADPDAYLDGPGSLASLVQTTFAQLQQLDPQIVTLYRDRKLWESMHADLAASELRRRFTATVQQQRQTFLVRAAGRWGVLLAPLRWLLTIGAALWFPIVQPVLSVLLAQGTWQISKKVLGVVVDALGVAHLLQCVTFLLLWFVLLWILLRWSTQRRIGRMIRHWKTVGADDPLSLPGQAMQWVDELLDPIRQRRQRVQSLLDRAQALRGQLKAEAPDPARAVPEPVEGRSAKPA